MCEGKFKLERLRVHFFLFFLPKLQQHLSLCETISVLHFERVKKRRRGLSSLELLSRQLGLNLLLGSVCRLEILGQALEPPPPSTLHPVTHQHDFQWSPRAGGAPSGKNKQTWRPWECKCTDPAHLTLREYGSSAPAILLAWVKACF